MVKIIAKGAMMLLNVLNDTDNHKYVNLVLIRISF